MTKIKNSKKKKKKDYTEDLVQEPTQRVIGVCSRPREILRGGAGPSDGGRHRSLKDFRELGLRGESMAESGAWRSFRFWCERLRETCRERVLETALGLSIME